MSARSSFLAAAALALAGCGLFSSPDPRTVLAKLEDFKPRIALKTAWHAGVGKSERFVFSPAVVGERVYAASAKGELAAFSAADGRQVWRVDTGQRLSAGVGASATRVIVGTPKGDLLAYDENGKPAWKMALASELLAPVDIDGGIVVVRLADGRLLGLEAADGKQKWLYSRTNPALALRTTVGVTLARGAVFGGFAGGLVAALDLETGRVGWEANIATPRGSTELERVADVASLPVVDGDQVCAGSYQGRVGCMELVSGRMIWSRDASSSAGVALDASNVYVSDEAGQVLAFDRKTGSSLWKQDKLANRRLGTPIVSGRNVLVGDGFGYIHALAVEDGSFTGRLATDGSPITAPPQAMGDKIVFQTRNGGVYAVQVQ